MPRHRQLQLLCVYAGAIVVDLDQLPASLLDRNGNACRASIDGVFD
jgi:hypothetical protein